MTRVLVTGATGFIGRHVIKRLIDQGCTPRRALRAAGADLGALESMVVGDINARTDWSAALHNIDVVIHLAARVHMLRDTAADPLAAFRAVNTQGTLHLAHAARAQGVKRLVFVSTIGVNGDETPIDQPFDESAAIAPHSPYARSKWEAEQALHQLDGLEVVIVRPPLVYGIDAPGNFAQLMRFVRLGLPLPLGTTHNRRSLIAVQNLADFLTLCVDHPAAAGETFVISDDEALSTAQLVRRVGQALGKTPLLLPFPPEVLRGALTTMGRRKLAAQLFGSLVIDNHKAHAVLGWRARTTLEQSLSV